MYTQTLTCCSAVISGTLPSPTTSINTSGPYLLFLCLSPKLLTNAYTCIIYIYVVTYVLLDCLKAICSTSGMSILVSLIYSNSSSLKYQSLPK